MGTSIFYVTRIAHLPGVLVNCVKVMVFIELGLASSSSSNLGDKCRQEHAGVWNQRNGV